MHVKFKMMLLKKHPQTLIPNDFYPKEHLNSLTIGIEKIPHCDIIIHEPNIA